MASSSESSLTSASQSARYRYPGPASFQDNAIDYQLFFGRKTEITDVVDNIIAEQTLVLFGLSGLGKTSMLQAGVFPQLRKRGFLPVPVRLNEGVTVAAQSDGNGSTDLQSAIIASLRQELQRPGINVDGLDDDYPDLRTFFQSIDIWFGSQLLVPVLVFDQFEEIFTLHDKQFRDSLATQIALLLARRRPHVQRQDKRQSGENDNELDGLTDAAPELRIVFSLREEWVGSLEALVTRLPALLEYRYQLLPLDRLHAKNAIVGPAAIHGNSTQQFLSPEFTYDDPALTRLLDYMASRKGHVEPFQLQLICQHIERKVIEQQSATDMPKANPADSNPVDIIVTSHLLGSDSDLDQALHNYYQTSLQELGLLKGRTRKLCEALLNPDDRRRSLDEQTVQRKYKLNKADLNRVLDSHLVRAVSRPGLDGFYYELSHDTLARTVATTRDKRRSRRNWLGAVAGVCVVFAAGTSYIYQSRQVVTANLQSETAMLQSESAMLQSESALKAYITELAKLQKVDGYILPVPELITAKAGTFNMGSDSKRSDPDEQPVHPVTLSQFDIGKTEITFEQYDAYLADKLNSGTQTQVPGDQGWGRELRPVINVSWHDAREYATWLGPRLDPAMSCGLPTEAEWEYAARAGSATEFFWGDSDDQAAQFGVFNKVSTDEVASLKPNNFGLHDTAGNVWEWVDDCYQDTYSKAPADGSAVTGPASCPRSLRGGAFSNNSVNLRSAYRDSFDPDARSYFIGFRVVCRPHQ